jgi:hypothetical protein
VNADAAARDRINRAAEEWAVTREHLDRAIGTMLPSPVQLLQRAVRRHARELALSQRSGFGRVAKSTRDELLALADDVNRLAVRRRAAGTLEDDVFSDVPSHIAEQRLAAAREAQQQLAGAVADARSARDAVIGLLDGLERVEAQKAEPDPPVIVRTWLSMSPASRGNMGAIWEAQARTAMTEWEGQKVTPAEREAFEAGKAAQLAALEQPLRDAVTTAVDMGERASRAQAEVEAALQGDAEPAGEQ